MIGIHCGSMHWQNGRGTVCNFDGKRWTASANVRMTSRILKTYQLHSSRFTEILHLFSIYFYCNYIGSECKTVVLRSFIDCLLERGSSCDLCARQNTQIKITINPKSNPINKKVVSLSKLSSIHTIFINLLNLLSLHFVVDFYTLLHRAMFSIDCNIQQNHQNL